MKIVTVLGARPQFVKAAALSRALKNYADSREVIVHTGQHYDKNMSDIFFEQMQIPKPDYFLDVVATRHGEMTGRMLESVEKVLIEESPDLVLVYGDTNSTLAGALAARKLNIRIAHVEAGLRSYNNMMPEETNRILTDRISDYLFCPGEQAVSNLRKEGFLNFPCQIHMVGDIMKDVAFYYNDYAKKPSFRIPENFTLATIHRAENTNDTDRLKKIMEALAEMSRDTPVVLPLHPRTRSKCEALGFTWSENIIIEEPVGYLEMIWLLKQCNIVVTDSGGLQKEAYFFRKPCITIRDQTEWTELTEAGYNIVTGVEKDAILSAREKFKTSPPVWDVILYGDGMTADKIVKIIYGNFK